MTASDTATDVSTEIEAWLGTNPDPGIPCESAHSTGYACSDDGMADWYTVHPCGCSKYVCQGTRNHAELVASRALGIMCNECGAVRLNDGRLGEWRRIR